MDLFQSEHLEIQKGPKSAIIVIVSGDNPPDNYTCTVVFSFQSTLKKDEGHTEFREGDPGLRPRPGSAHRVCGLADECSIFLPLDLSISDLCSSSSTLVGQVGQAVPQQRVEVGMCPWSHILVEQKKRQGPEPHILRPGFCPPQPVLSTSHLHTACLLTFLLPYKYCSRNTH